MKGRLIPLLATLLPAAPAVAQTPPVQPPQTATAGEVWVDPVLQMRFRYVPAGTFLMGSPPSDPLRTHNEAQHRVHLTRGFWIGEAEVTQVEWGVLVPHNPSFFSSCGPDCPVESLNWYEAAAFANALSERSGLEACYDLSGCGGTLGGGCPGQQKCEGDFRCDTSRFKGLDCAGYRLPTEAEWERAARAGTDTPLYTGPLEVRGPNDAPSLDLIAWYGGNSGVAYTGGVHCSQWKGKQESAGFCGTQPVRRKQPNAWGLHDVIGNVWEITEDRAEWDAANERLLTSGTWEDGAADPLGTTGPKHVLRGASWYNFAKVCRIAQRGSTHTPTRVRTAGFRLVRTAQEASRPSGVPSRIGPMGGR